MLKEDYIVGLVDGEGSFTVYVCDPKRLKERNRRRRVRVEPKFYVKIVENDKKILYDLKKFFGCGNVYFQRDVRVNHENCYRYEVSNRGDLTKIIIPFFKKHFLLFPSRIKDFKVFCQIIDAVKRNEHLSKRGLAKLYKLKQKMH